MELLLRMQISEFTLPLSCHPPLSLHNLFRIVRASGGLVSLRGVEAVQVRAWGATTGFIEVVHGMAARAAMGNPAVCIKLVRGQQTQMCRSPGAAAPCNIRSQTKGGKGANLRRPPMGNPLPDFCKFS